MVVSHGNLYVIVTCPSYGCCARPRCSLLKSGRGGMRGERVGGGRGTMDVRRQGGQS